MYVVTCLLGKRTVIVELTFTEERYVWDERLYRRPPNSTLLTFQTYILSRFETLYKIKKRAWHQPMIFLISTYAIIVPADVHAPDGARPSLDTLRWKNGQMCFLYSFVSHGCVWLSNMLQMADEYRRFSNIIRTKYQNINVSRLVLQWSLPNPLKPGVKLRTKM